MVPQSKSAFSADIKDFVERAYGLQIRGAKVLTGGFESDVYQLDCGDSIRVVRIGPQWRLSKGLHVSYVAAAYAAKSMPEVPAPYPTNAGALVTRHANRPISLWPYIDGRNVNPTNEVEAHLAAAALARLHRRLSGASLWRLPGQTLLRDRRTKQLIEPRIVKDDELDRWLRDRSATQPMGPTHGDYWRNNLIFNDEKIVGIIDWDDSRIASVERELSSAVWEFCADPVQGTLSVARAAQFLDVYAKHDGPVHLSDRSFIAPFIRDYLRSEIRQALKTGGDIEGGSLAGSLRAFTDLRRWSL
jgi:Ser/Thr protein kinase RdoA (MazF antagonist)